MAQAYAGIALAQEDRYQPVGNVIAKLAVILDNLLNFWVNSVTGNTLTHPQGELFVASISELTRNFVHFFAQLVALF
jgi:hypothetical protein